MTFIDLKILCCLTFSAAAADAVPTKFGMSPASRVVVDRENNIQSEIVTRDAHHASRDLHSTSRDSHQSPRDLHSTSRDLHPTSRDSHQSARDLHPTSRDTQQASRDPHQTLRGGGGDAASEAGTYTIDQVLKSNQELVAALGIGFAPLHIPTIPLHVTSNKKQLSFHYLNRHI